MAARLGTKCPRLADVDGNRWGDRVWVNSSFARLGLGHFPLTPTAAAVGCILYAEHVRQLRVKVPSQPDGGEG
jgi:hypothetical protein